MRLLARPLPSLFAPDLTGFLEGFQQPHRAQDLSSGACGQCENCAETALVKICQSSTCCHPVAS